MARTGDDEGGGTRHPYRDPSPHEPALRPTSAAELVRLYDEGHRDFSGAQLSGADLSRAHLQGIVLRDAKLRRARFSRATLKAADLSGADLLGAELRGVNALDARLHRATLQCARLSQARLVGADAQEADLSGGELDGADLTWANLSATKLVDAIVRRAKLVGARLYQAELVDANLEAADLRKASLEGALAVEANLEGATLAKANLDGANLRKACLARADLRGARVGACLVAADLREADLREADLREADLWMAKLQCAVYDDATRFPRTFDVAAHSMIREGERARDARPIEVEAQREGRIGYSPTKLGYVAEADLVGFLSKQYGVPAINLGAFDVDDNVLELIPADLARRCRCIPINRAGASLVVAFADPTDKTAIEAMKAATGLNVEVVVAGEAAIAAGLDKWYGEETDP